MNSVLFIVGYFQRKQKRLGWRLRNDGGLETLFLVLLVVPVIPVDPVVSDVLVVCCPVCPSCAGYPSCPG